MTFIVSRMDLADTGSPEGLVLTILKMEPQLVVPVPIEELCIQLDIEEIATLDTDGFEGGLITDVNRSRGIVLVNSAAPRKRRRFTIAHELGHFLMPSHVPNAEGRFLCSRKDMMSLGAKEGDRRAQMEVEANRFASLLLIPPPYLRRQLAGRKPDIAHMVELAEMFDSSKEAMARAYADLHAEPVALIIVENGIVRRRYANKKRFPFITVPNGKPVPRGSTFHSAANRQGQPSDLRTVVPDLWIDVLRDMAAPSITEQVYLQASGFAMIMLWYEPPEEAEEENDERTAKERWRDQQERWNR
jgi:IrrE N-terminal-like domain